jgi:hypothetical protein
MAGPTYAPAVEPLTRPGPDFGFDVLPILSFFGIGAGEALIQEISLPLE